jgi:uncharacterized protein YggE
MNCGNAMVITSAKALAENMAPGKRSPQKPHNRLRQKALQTSGGTMAFRPARLIIVALGAMLAAPPVLEAAETDSAQPVIVVSGEADASVAPDVAVVTLGVTKLEKTARAALDGNNKAMADILKALKDDGIASKDLQTSGFSIQPQYAYPENGDGTQKPPVLTGYQVTNMLTVRLRDPARLGAVLDQTVTLGVNQGGDIRFTNDDPARTITEARTAAVKAAFAKARTLADAAGVKLGRVVKIAEDVTPPQPQPLMRMQMAKQTSDAVPVAGGENSYSVRVDVTFAIEQ